MHSGGTQGATAATESRESRAGRDGPRATSPSPDAVPLLREVNQETPRFVTGELSENRRWRIENGGPGVPSSKILAVSGSRLHALQTLACSFGDPRTNCAKRLECVRLADALGSVASAAWDACATEKREQAPRTPNAGALLRRSSYELREAFGVVRGTDFFRFTICAVFCCCI